MSRELPADSSDETPVAALLDTDHTPAALAVAALAGLLVLAAVFAPDSTASTLFTLAALGFASAAGRLSRKEVAK